MTQKTPKQYLSNYGVVKIKDRHFLDHIIERPQKGQAPSNLVTYGRYLLKPSIFEKTDELIKEHKAGEFLLVNALTKLASNNKILVKKTKGTWLTTGDPLNHLKTQVAFALQHDNYKDEMHKFLKKLFKNLEKK